MTRFILLFFTLTAAAAFAHGPGGANDFGGRRVLFIGIDGCRADAMQRAMEGGFAPQLKALAEGGVFSLRLYAGGDRGTATEQPTVSGPGWSTLLTGGWHDKHHVISNSFKNNTLARFPHFMRYIKELKPGARCASFTSWPEVNRRIVEDSRADPKEANFVDAVFSGTTDKSQGKKGAPEEDIDVREAAVDEMLHQDPDVMFIHFNQVDEYGHGSVDRRGSFSPDNALYIHGLAMVDSHIGEVLHAMHRRPRFAEENWLILVTTDHGGRGHGHGGQSDEERNIWLIAQGPNLPKEDLLSKPFGQPYLPRLVFRHLGLSVNPAWNWEPDPFSKPAEPQPAQ